jgi:hypothetical protein
VTSSILIGAEHPGLAERTVQGPILSMQSLPEAFIDDSTISGRVSDSSTDRQQVLLSRDFKLLWEDRPSLALPLPLPSRTYLVLAVTAPARNVYDREDA